MEYHSTKGRFSIRKKTVLRWLVAIVLLSRTPSTCSFTTVSSPLSRITFPHQRGITDPKKRQCAFLVAVSSARNNRISQETPKQKLLLSEARKLSQQLLHEKEGPNSSSLLTKTLLAWSRISDRREGARHAEELLLSRLNVATQEHYQIVLQAFLSTKNPVKAQQWLQKMEQKWTMERSKERTNNSNQCWSSELLLQSFNMCIDAFSTQVTIRNCGGTVKALKLLRRLEKLAHLDAALQPNKISYTSALRGLSKGGKADEANRLLQEMEVKSMQPDSMAYSFVIHALANSKGGERSALAAEELLKDMAKSKVAKPNAYTYEGVLMAWSRCGMKGAQRALDILKHMERLYASKKGNHDIRPLTMNVNAVVKAWSVCRGGVRAAQQCEEILMRMNPERGDEKSYKVWPNMETVNLVISAWLNSGSKDAPQQAERILADYVAQWNENCPEKRQLNPQVWTYNLILSAYSKQRGRDSARKAEALLYRLMNILPIEVKNANDVAKSFGYVISCWSKSKQASAGERAEQLLRIMEKRVNEGQSTVKPNVIIYSQVIAALAKSSAKNSHKKARALFDEMMDSKATRPNTITFNSLLDAYANSNDPEVVQEAGLLVDQMKKLSKSPGWDVQPDSRTMGSYLLCLARAENDPLRGAKSQEVLSSMIDQAVAGNSKMEPDSFVITTTINAWMGSESPGASDAILGIIQQMEELYNNKVIRSRPHAISFNTAIRHFVNKNELQRADELVMKMENWFLDGVREAAPDRRTYAGVLNGYAQSNDPTAGDHALNLFERQQRQVAAGNRAAKPNNICFNMVMASLSNNRDPDSVARIMMLFEDMKQQHARGNREAMPDKVSYTTVITALAKSQDQESASKAIHLLTEMDMLRRRGDKSVRPNLICFNSVLNVLSKARTKAAAIKAEELLRNMKDLSSSSTEYQDVRPDRISYTSVIDAWAGVKVEGAPQHAEDFLREMQHLARSDKCLQPDAVTYNKVLLSWARAGDVNHVTSILREMQLSDSVSPDSFSYKTALLAWSQQANGAKHAEYLLGVMESQPDLHPDELCYKAVATAWRDEGCDEKHGELCRRLEKLVNKKKR